VISDKALLFVWLLLIVAFGGGIFFWNFLEQGNVEGFILYVFVKQRFCSK
jgi:hypothetical protein